MKTAKKGSRKIDPQVLTSSYPKQYNRKLQYLGPQVNTSVTCE